MSLFDCIQRAIDDPVVKADKARGQRAQEEWRRRADRYEADGNPRHIAEALAGADVKAAFKKEAGEKRHVFLAVAAQQRKSQALVRNTAEPNMMRRMEVLDYKQRGLVRRFHGRLQEYLLEHHRDIFGNVTNQAGELDLANELHGFASGNEKARAIGDAVKVVIEEMRVMFNEAGGLINKLDNYGLPHKHDPLALKRAGFDAWFSDIDARLDWDKILDPLTGKPILRGADGKVSIESRRSYLRDAYRNIVFGKEAGNPAYGKPDGVATYRKHADSRHLHFKSGKDWMEYNARFGSGGIHASLMGHIHRMARDITLMREFGPNPKLGAQYEADLWAAKAAGAADIDMMAKVDKDSARALRAMSVLSGGPAAKDGTDLLVANIMSNMRGLVTAARLDRAIIASLSDLNSMRMAAKAMGMNANGVLARQVGAIRDLSPDDRLRAGWIADTMADAGNAVARFQNEHAMSDKVEKLVQASMRVQGLSAWTDRARFSAYSDFSGFMAEHSGKPLNDLPDPLQKHLKKWGVTEADWDEYRKPENLFTADSGATFAFPMDFRNKTSLPAEKANDLYFKFSGATEEFMEWAVPTRSVLAQAFTDPAAFNLSPGSAPYEIMKSFGQFKSFTMTFSINQYRQIQAQGGFTSKKGAAYTAELVVGATLLGALSLQVNEILLGRDPQDMTKVAFWARALAKGGGAGIMGDIVSTGQTSWGGGFSSYVAGPMPQTLQDIWGLTIGNALTASYQLATGEDVDVNFAQDLAKFGKAYTPMGQTPLVGPVLDRMIWDQMAIYLDPEAHDALISAAQKRANLNGSGDYFLPGDLGPWRWPDWMNAVGQ